MAKKNNNRYGTANISNPRGFVIVPNSTVKERDSIRKETGKRVYGSDDDLFKAGEAQALLRDLNEARQRKQSLEKDLKYYSDKIAVLTRLKREKKPFSILQLNHFNDKYKETMSKFNDLNSKIKDMESKYSTYFGKPVGVKHSDSINLGDYFGVVIKNQ